METVALCALVLLAPALVVACVPPWTAPPPEFDDVTGDSRAIDLPTPGWSPARGAPATLLDVLPPGAPAIADANHDGWPDLYVPTTRLASDALDALARPTSRLFLNDASDPGIDGEAMVDVSDVAHVDVRGYAYAAAWGDANGDGWPDLFVGGYHLARLFLNAQDGTFRDATAQAGLPQDGFIVGAAWGDYDGDGRQDLALAELGDYDISQGLVGLHDVAPRANVLLHNEGTGAFRDASAASGIASLASRSTSVRFVDVDHDGAMDLVFTTIGGGVEAWRNAGAGTFVESSAALGLVDAADGTCQAWEDFNNDGLLDVFVAHRNAARDALFLAQPSGGYADASTLLPPSTGDAWGCAALDYDGDADMDLYVAHGSLDGSKQRSTLYTNLLRDGGGALGFRDDTSLAGDNSIADYSTRETLATPDDAGGAVAYDWALTGTPDIMVAEGAGGHLRSLKNVGWAGGWAGGSGDYVNVWLPTNASGARVTVQAGDINVTRVFGGGASLGELTFGIQKDEPAGYCGQNTPVSLTIAWPDGRVDAWPHWLTADRSVRVAEGAAPANDTLAPHPSFRLVSGTAGAHGWYSSSAVTLKVTASDGSTAGGSNPGVTQSVRWSLDGVAWTTMASPTTTGVTLTFAGDGTRTLYIDAVDKAGNRAVSAYPVRIDSTAPVISAVAPQPGDVWAQGRLVAHVDALAMLGRAVVLAPAPAQAGTPADAASGAQPVVASASDATSGVSSVGFQLLDSAGRVRASHEERYPAYAWAWPANETGAGEYALATTATDHAGLTATQSVIVDVLPTSADGVLASLTGAPSPARGLLSSFFSRILKAEVGEAAT